MAGTDVVTRTPMQAVLSEVASEGFIAKLANALPENLTPQKFVSVTVTAIKTNPALIAADRDSLYNSIVRCAQDGLMPDNREAALVVYRVKGVDRVQYLPMIGGLRKRLAEHGFDLTTYVVYENDKFDYQLGDEPWVKHKPAKLGTPRGKPIGAYAIAEDTRTHKRYIDVMDVAQIEQVRAVSRAATSEYGPWVKWWDEQARKTVGRRLAKTLPLADPEAVAKLMAAIDAEYDLPNPNGQGNGQPVAMSEEEANIVAVSRNLPDPPDEDTRVRDEPSDRPDEAQLNRLANLAQTYGNDDGITAYLVGSFGVESFDDLTAAQAAQAESALARLVKTKPLEGEYDDPGPEAPFAGMDAQPPEQASFESMVPESVKKEYQS